ncbi:Fungalysin metallopeptidase-domain-containing protein [Globomyces pollinis-pini]|nr:Fungalysin metallopeptidase-domain-containing protein [Globomyces pollinis-pini]
MNIKNIILICSVVHSHSRKAKSELKQNSLPLYWSPNSSFDSSLKNQNLTTQLSFDELKTVSVKWVADNLSMGKEDEVVIKNAYTDSNSGLHHCYMIKRFQGLDIVNSVVSLTIDTSGNVISQGNQWVNTDSSVKLLKRGEGVNCSESLSQVGKTLGYRPNTMLWNEVKDGQDTIIMNVKFTAFQNVTCKEKLYQLQSQTTKHIWDISLNTGFQHLNFMVDKSNGKILGASDWTSNLVIENNRLMKRIPQINSQTFQYRVIPIGGIDPISSNPELIVNPADRTASPIGWHFENKDISFGNNVFATSNVVGERNLDKVALNGKHVQGTNFKYDFRFDDQNQQPSQYREATITNAFYLANTFHDILYHYGFDEQAGNFQFNNNGKADSKTAGDPVMALIHDGGRKNNAFFSSPPDGQPGVMRLLIFDRAVKLGRDVGLDNTVVLHELTHGLSSRLTGGPSQANCLQKLQSAGLGEGWSDIVSVVLEMTEQDTRNDDQLIGKYVSNNMKNGVRSHPYSTSLDKNPLKYSDLSKRKQSHAIGEVWATMLFEVYWNMVDKLGFDRSFLTSSNGSGGNTKFLLNLVNAMKMQPCNPTIVQARDAFIAADKAVNQGANLCEIVEGFSKRGLGSLAKDNIFKDDSSIPIECLNR